MPLEHQAPAAQLGGEHAGSGVHRRQGSVEDGRSLAGRHRPVEREAQCLERHRQVLGLGVAGGGGHHGAPEHVEGQLDLLGVVVGGAGVTRHRRLIHARSPGWDRTAAAGRLLPRPA